MDNKDVWRMSSMSGFSSFGSPFDGFGFAGIMFTIVPLFIMGVFLYIIISSITRWSSNNASPRLNRPARIVGKRPHTWGGSGRSSAHTSYYVTFEFEDRERLELPVRAQEYGMMAEGDYGILTHQGTRFIDFQREP
jgi:hypothetical protein